jgi:hypothetical protein
MPDKKPQIEKFREAARELETDDSDEYFDAIAAKIATAPKLSDEEIKDLAQLRREKMRALNEKVAKAKQAPLDKAVARAGKGAVVRSKKAGFPISTKSRGR